MSRDRDHQHRRARWGAWWLDLGIRFGPELLALGLSWWMLAQRKYLLVDDAYISFRYAANFARGHGLVWNVGIPVEGYTCLLWVLLLLCFARLGIDLTVPSVLLSMLFGLACLRLQRNVLRHSGLEAEVGAGRVLPCLLLASVPSFAHAMTSGMEETCFAFVVTAALHLLVLGRSRPAMRGWAAAAFATACLIRPEGPLVAAIALTTELVAGGSLSFSRLKQLLLPGLAVGAVVAAHMLLRRSYYGYWFPNTFYAKVIFGQVTLERGTHHVVGFVLAGGYLLFFGLPSKHTPVLRPWLVHGYALTVVYCTYLLLVGGDHPHWYRFYVTLLPLPLLGTALRFWAWWRAAARHWSELARTSFSLLAQVACGAMIWFQGLPFSEAVEPIVGFISPQIEKLMHDADRFFDQVPDDSFCAVAAIGHVGYRHLDLHVLDTWGLTDTHIAHKDVAPNAKFGHDKQDFAYVAAMKPDYLYILVPRPAPPMPGYDLCWPSETPPGAVYRRTTALAPSDESLGVPASRKRRLAMPPPCQPPHFASTQLATPPL